MKNVEPLLLPVFQNIIREKLGEKAQKVYDGKPESIETFAMFYISRTELYKEMEEIQERNSINLPHSWEDIYIIDDELYVHIERNSALEERIVICFYVLNKAEEIKEKIKKEYMNFIRSSLNIGFDPIPVLNEKITGVEIEWCNFETIEITATHTHTNLKISPTA